MTEGQEQQAIMQWQKLQRQPPRQAMGMITKITVDGEPVGKGRPRFCRRGDYVQTYTPTKTQAYESRIKAAYLLDGHVMQGPVKICITAYYQIPKSVSKAKRQDMLDGKILPQKKPDVDNVAKIVLDALNQVAYQDDKQVAELHVYRYYSDCPRVEIEIEEMERSA